MAGRPRLRPSRGQIRALIAIDELTRSMGYPPTLSEISTKLGNRSPNAANDFVCRLQVAGLVTRVPKVARGLLITEEGKDVLLYERVEARG